jgi:hypothetical protein
MREGIEKDHPAWMNDARLLDALGEAFGEAFRFEEAVQYYDLAIGRGKATASIKAIEQSANFHIRLAVQNLDTAAWKYPGTKKVIAGQINKIHKLMDTLVETPERWSMIGGGHKRLAQISAEINAKACNAALEDMEQAYGKARKLQESAYPRNNELSAKLMRSLRAGKPTAERLAELKALMETAVAQAKKEAQGSPDDFWAKTAVTDATLLEHLHKFLGGRQNSLNEKIIDELVKDYKTAWRQFGSARELNSIIENYAFLAAVLKNIDKNRSLFEALEKILNSLKSMYAEG